MGKPDDIDSAVDFITTVMGRAGSDKLDRALKVGKFLFDNFFGGDPLAVSSRSKDSPSFLALCSDGRLADLAGGRKTLSNYVRVHVLTEQLPPETSGLGLSQRIKLLPAEPADQQRIAVKAAAEGWSARRVADAVADASRKRQGKRTAESVEPAVGFTMSVNYSARQLKDIPLDSLRTNDLRWLYSRLLDAVGLLEDAIENAAGEWVRRGEKGSMHILSDAFVVDSVEELDDLIEHITGIRPDPTEQDPEELKRRFDRLARRLKATMVEAPEAAKDWWKTFLASVGTGPVRGTAQTAKSAQSGGTTKSVSLASKYRPRRFSEVVGNTSAVAKMRGLVKSWPSRAFLIHGPSGTGKTTLARIWARSYLCNGTRPGGVEPCEACERCDDTRLNKPQVWGPPIDEIGAATFSRPEYAAQQLSDRLHNQSDVIIVNEADRLLIRQQQFLDYLDEDQHKPVIFCTADVAKFDDQFVGRCILVGTEAIFESDMIAFMRRVAEQEGVSLTDDEVKAVLAEMSPSARTQARDALMGLEVRLAGQRG